MNTTADWIAAFLIGGGLIFLGMKMMPGEDLKDVQLKQQQEQIVRLEAELRGMERGLGLSK